MGTKPQWTAGPADAGLRLDRFLADPERLGSRPRAAAALERGKVTLNGNDVDRDAAGLRLSAGDVVSVWIDRPGTAKRPPRTGVHGGLHVIFEDASILVVNKPPGLLTVPLERKGSAPSLYAQVLERFRSHGKRRLFVVHRIDQDTSGLVVFAKNEDAQHALLRQFKRRQPERVYLAVVQGHPSPAAGTWRDHLVWDEKALIQKPTSERDSRGTEAIAEYRIIETFDRASLIEVRLQTGRRNQIRLQAQLRGHPLVGEKRYAPDAEDQDTIPFRRQALHAARVAFSHPVDGRRMDLEAPLPPDLVDLLARLRRRR